MSIEKLLVILRFDGEPQPTLHLTVKVNKMRIDVVQPRVFGSESERHRQPAAEGLDIATVFVILPERLDVRNQPALATGPLQWRLEEKIVRHFSVCRLERRTSVETNGWFDGDAALHRLIASQQLAL